MSMLIGAVETLPTIIFFVAAFLLVLTVVVFVHELGHFLVARRCGVMVSTFSIGFGREIFGFVDRHGTRWRVAWIPLGGYVKFIDDENAASVPGKQSGTDETSRSGTGRYTTGQMDNSASAAAEQANDQQRQLTPEEKAGRFHTKPIWKRAAVVAAGPIANFILAIAIFAIMFMIYGQYKLSPKVQGVVPGSPAAAAGFKAGDLVRRVNGKEIDDFAELQQIVATSPKRQLKVAVERSGDLVTLSVTPILKERYDRIAGKHMRPEIGLQASRDRSLVSHRDVGPLHAVQLGAERTWTIISQTVNYINDIIWQRQRADQVGGIIRIADASGKVAQLGPEYIIQFIAFLSVSIGFINLLPIPLLDGGHLMFYAVEAVRGRPLSDRTQEMSFKVGLALVISLMLFATWNDRVVVKSWFQQPPAENQSQ